MKIISKYKDFYDSFGYILGKPDESIVYIRNTEIIKNDDKRFNKQKKFLDDYTYYEYGYRNKNEGYRAVINVMVCGIYPYLYMCPFYIIVSVTNYDNYLIPVYDIDPIPVSFDDIKNKDYDRIYNKVQVSFNKFANENHINSKSLKISEINSKGGKYGFYKQFNFINNNWKVENIDIFKELGVPTFVYTHKNSLIYNIFNYHELILNPVFTKMDFNVLGSNMDDVINNSNVYIDIENFLWSMKQEPEAKPDNNTKIINAGFDLKTSFRNVK